MFDIAFAISGLVVMGLPMTVLYALNKFKLDGESPFFTITRLGKDGKPFEMYKFRSMKTLYNNEGKILPETERVTSFGQFMRKRGLDELPQLFNILKGDMSVVGPRPWTARPTRKRNVLKDYTILNVRPGLTGVCAVEKIMRGYELSGLEREKLESEYARQPESLSRDFALIVKTMPVLWSGNSPQKYEQEARDRGDIEEMRPDQRL
ncbi:MAG: sugar transferase [Alphaproteobacteria bacterium]|nr:sugar transferase [Alphaproteobacteria bacterium]